MGQSLACKCFSGVSIFVPWDLNLHHPNVSHPAESSDLNVICTGEGLPGV